MRDLKAKKAYDTAYESTPAQIKKRSQRNKARREYQSLHGAIPSSLDIDHKKMIKDGGTNAPSNLRAVTEHQNRGWRRGKKKV